MKFTDLNLNIENEVDSIMLDGDIELHVRKYLPIDEVTELIGFVVDSALDASTGCFSPIRTEVYFSLAICHWFGGIDFSEDDLTNAGKTYDKLEYNGVIGSIIEAIDATEYHFIEDMVNETIKDIARYNNSAAGIIAAMNNNASGLGEQIEDILSKVKNAEGLENLSVIKDVVGKD